MFEHPSFYYVFAFYQLVLGIVTIWTAFAFFRKRSGLTWTMLVSGILTAVFSVLAQVLIAMMAADGWLNSSTGMMNLFQIGWSAGALGGLVFHVVLLIYLQRRRDELRRIEQLEAILQDCMMQDRRSLT
jgi:tellurite resistance protein TehA-like permease